MAARLLALRGLRLAHVQISPYLQSRLAPTLIRSTLASRLYSTPPSPPTGPSETSLQTKEAKAPLGKRVWAVIKKEATHFWHGTKLLGKEIKISARIQGRLLMGKKLTRRERRQLKRTTQDLLRLIPFSVFVIIPFMELLLPVALKLFPNMLPSTFTDDFKEQEKKRKLLKVRLEMAKFLQETIREGGLRDRDRIQNSEVFKEFFRKVRSTGEKPSVEEVVKVAKLFEDELTLDNLTRPQLVSMCRYMNINAFGTDNFLKYTIRSRMKVIKSDDEVINSEGIDALNTQELKHACQSRGIRTTNKSEEHLRKELGQWINLHLNHGLSGTLLILSKAFSFDRSEDQDLMQNLKDTLASLPDTLLSETELEVSGETSYKRRLEVLQQQEELIESEQEQEDNEKRERQLKKEKEALKEEISLEELPETKSVEETQSEQERKVAETLIPPEVAVTTTDTVEQDVRLSIDQVRELGEALEMLTARSSVLKERIELKSLLNEHKKAEETGEATNPLSQKLKDMLVKLDKQLEEYDTEVEHKLGAFRLDLNKEGMLSVLDLKRALELIRHRPDDEAIKVLLNKLDVDGDTWVPLEDIVQLAEGEGLGIDLSDEEPGAELVSEAHIVRGKTPRPHQVTDKTVDTESKEEPKKDKKLKKEDVVEDNFV